MKSDKYKIEVAGVKYEIERCFDSSPAIYWRGGDSYKAMYHVDEDRPEGLKDDNRVAIIARICTE